MRRFGTFLGVALAIAIASNAVVPGLAFADPTPEEIEAARTSFKEGLELEKAGNYEAALAKFQLTAQVKTTAQVRFHIALCNEKLGHLSDAAAGYDAAAKQAQTDGNAAEVLKVAPDLATKVRARMPKLTIAFKGSETPETLKIDGKDIGVTDVKALPLDPGPHVIEAAKADKSARSEIKLAEGESKTVTVDLAGGEAPVVYTEKAEKVDDEPTKKDEGPVDTKKTQRTIGWIVGGVGVASLIASGVFYGVRASKVSALDRACPNLQCPPSAQSDIDTAKTMTTLSRITLGVGVVAVGTGVVLLLTGKKPAPEEPKSEPYARIVPWAPSASFGLGVEGAF